MPQVPVGKTVHFRNPEDQGLIMGGQVLAYLPKEDGYLMVCHYVIRPEDLLDDVRGPAHLRSPMAPYVAERRSKGASEHEIAMHYDITLEDLHLTAPIV
jgi:hypothetical protein